MPLQQVECAGNSNIFTTTEGPVQLFYECIKVKKVFDEFGLRDCIEGIVFELDCAPVGGTIEPTLILRHCRLCDSSIRDASKRDSSGDLEIKRLRFIGKCCCEVFGKDEAGNIIRMRPVFIPENNKFSIGPDDTLCISFSVRRTYDDLNSISDSDFERLLHFIEEGRFELQCLTEAIIDEDNNETCDNRLETNLGTFLVVKFDTEVQLCVPVLGYCFVEEIAEEEEEGFCENFEDEFEFPFPDFNPPQLIDVYPEV